MIGNLSERKVSYEYSGGTGRGRENFKEAMYSKNYNGSVVQSGGDESDMNWSNSGGILE